jgi:hypothetical protein
MLWDDDCLYIAFIVKDSHITVGHARNPYNSNTGVSADDCVEFFWIPGTPDTLFYQYEINCIGIVLSTFNYKRPSPSQSIRLQPPQIGQTFQGTVNDSSDVDTGYFVELALRFSDYPHMPIEKPSDLSKIYTSLPRLNPKAGNTWRMNLNRINRFADGRRINSMWSHNNITGRISSFFHCPRDFGYLHFSAEPVR